ncbi:MAG TPA: NUDIX domain-containing protein [Clostridiales bacterium]|nr:NUDIX domain-containing protein [Clostridiales bacterium]HPU67632.1 NUDIX domain-containing protein [Clostridiales bacterium]HXK83025.1 NUDIX domain-containing protein [Clostridiales bacterium]
MLGRYVKVSITAYLGRQDEKDKLKQTLNAGIVSIKSSDGGSYFADVYILGASNVQKEFSGRIIAVLNYYDGSAPKYVVAPKRTRFINFEIITALEDYENPKNYSLDCLYEVSCGAVVAREINNEIRYLLIKNKRSNHWGFPKGHMEKGETKKQTAAREVFEETGINIKFIEGFVSTSEYKIGGKVEKSVTIFLASTNDTKTVIQKTEIEDYVWLAYEQAMENLRFENDRLILERANEFLKERAEKVFGKKL